MPWHCDASSYSRVGVRIVRPATLELVLAQCFNLSYQFAVLHTCFTLTIQRYNNLVIYTSLLGSSFCHFDVGAVQYVSRELGELCVVGRWEPINLPFVFIVLCYGWLGVVRCVVVHRVVVLLLWS